MDELQKILVKFLHAEAHAGLTLLQTASIDAENDPAHAEVTIYKSQLVLNTIRRFLPRVGDPEARGEIEASADNLEARINHFKQAAPKFERPDQDDFVGLFPTEN